MALITEFISNVKSIGLARTNRYTVKILPPPKVLATIDSSTDKMISLFCDVAQLPGMRIATVPHRVFGEVREMPYDRMFEPITLSFYSDTNLDIKGFFERWIHSIMNQTARTLEYYENYIGTMYIDVDYLDELTIPAYRVQLHEVYPKSISEIQLGAERKEIMKIEVSFLYRYWTSSASDMTNNDPMSPFVGGQDPQGVQTGTGTTAQLETTR